MKKALITGINGQDGSYLAELLLEKGYEVIGIIRRSSCEDHLKRISHIKKSITLLYADITDIASLISVLQETKPNEIYNLAAQSDVHASFKYPVYTTLTTGMGCMYLLEAVRILQLNCRIYQASSSEIFGNNTDPDGFQRETTPMHPVSSYGNAKLFAFNTANMYRKTYNMFITNGILFNHESTRRGEYFVTSKICKEAARIKLNQSTTFSLGNLDSKRDWGHAKDYVHAMWLMLQQDQPDNFVCATGISHSVQELLEYVCNQLNIDPAKHVTIDKNLIRPKEVHDLKGDATKLITTTNWKPHYSFETLINEMIEYWLQKIKNSTTEI